MANRGQSLHRVHVNNSDIHETTAVGGLMNQASSPLLNPEMHIKIRLLVDAFAKSAEALPVTWHKGNVMQIEETKNQKITRVGVELIGSFQNRCDLGSF